MFKKISLSILAIALAAIFFGSCAFYKGDGFFNENSSEISSDGTVTSSLIAKLLDRYSYYDYTLTDEQLSKAIVAGYREITGDNYAYYYTDEEYKALTAESTGKAHGIGVTVIENTTYKCIEIISVVPNTPAEKAGIKSGDLIVQVGKGDVAEKTSDMGYEIALKKLQGDVGTSCDIGIVRDENFNDIIEFSIVRENFTTESVLHAISAEDPKVGIVKILNFDLTTPTQFKAAMADLIKKGCGSFVFDVRNNPGGDRDSVSAILSYFLNKGDVMIITEDSNKSVSETVCEPISRFTGDRASCNVAEEEIGMYRKYPAAVLINSSSASAAELFTGSLKSYGLATVVGETSYGKGCMQSLIALSDYDSRLTGAIKMTTKFYRPYGMDNYHGIGITPTEGYSVSLNDEAEGLNVYDLLLPKNQTIDDQLKLAIKAFEKQ